MVNETMTAGETAQELTTKELVGLINPLNSPDGIKIINKAEGMYEIESVYNLSMAGATNGKKYYLSEDDLSLIFNIKVSLLENPNQTLVTKKWDKATHQNIIFRYNSNIIPYDEFDELSLGLYDREMKEDAMTESAFILDELAEKINKAALALDVVNNFKSNFYAKLGVVKRHKRHLKEEDRQKLLNTEYPYLAEFWINQSIKNLYKCNYELSDFIWNYSLDTEQMLNLLEVVESVNPNFELDIISYNGGEIRGEYNNRNLATIPPKQYIVVR